jgi:4'-phosphopantetheinyl transferase EntD
MKRTKQDFSKELEAALQGIVPAGLSVAACEIPEKAVFAFEAEAKLLRHANEYRQREFVAGRFCAREALFRSGIRARAILSDEDGLPIWPAGGIAVISHSRGYCASVSGLRSKFSALGLDLEMTNRLSPSAIERIVHPIEQEYVQSDQRLASFIFCAKETFFKAQYPLWKTHANFKDVAFAADFGNGEARIVQIDDRFPEELVSLAPNMQFRFVFLGDFVISLCWLSRVAREA